MSDGVATVLAAWVQVLPALLALAGLTVVIAVSWRHLPVVLRRVSRIGVAGVVEVDLATDAIRTARPDTPLDDAQLSALDRRVARAADLVTRSRVLWVDDTPAGNAAERRYLRSAGVTVVNSLSTDEALRTLDRFDVDVVVTNMRRPESDTAGTDLLATMRRRGHRQPVVAYIGRVDAGRPVPAGLSGLTARPDELVHLLLDALERLG